MPYTLFSLTNPDRTQDRICHFQIGLPFPKGMLSVTADICLQDAQSRLVNVGSEVIQMWEDGSVKWLSVFGLHCIQAGDTCEITLSELPFPLTKQENPVRVISGKLCITLDNGETISFSEHEFWDLSIHGLQSTFCINQTSNLLHHSVNTHYKTYQSNGVFTAVVVNQSADLSIDGKALTVNQKSVVFLCDGSIKSQFTFTNPAAALHTNGQWDLGDPNSLAITEIGIAVDSPANLLKVKTIDNGGNQTSTDITNFETCSVVQLASGEINYNCPNHVDAAGKVPNVVNGYQITLDGEVVNAGKQCTPTSTFIDNTGNRPIYFEVDKFWEKFPSSLRVSSNTSHISLLGSENGPPLELQPGEQGSRSLFVSPNHITEAKVTINAQWVKSTLAVPFAPWDNHTSIFQSLISEGIEGQDSFFKKRLVIDEFGWRHFGELYADHERALAPETTHFISHYNNQYDPIQGMLYQWLVSGDHRWFELADDLAKHVSDIDIYHTQKDKPEYSGGLFWHTDHYVQAYRATHRTYSVDQPTNVYDDHAGGGGPGGQHCYTTGLLMHYWLTGYEPSRVAVVSQTDWISNYYEGDGTLLSTLLALKNAGTVGLKNVKTGKYPLDRGTGNYINALLDKFELTDDSAIIEHCGHIIRNTVSPHDDVNLRNFDNVEATWFYTVFLQSVCKFIAVKERQEHRDADYNYAVASLVHYAKWMANNEYAYLDKPDILEFPNQTWTGQDIRKLCVLNFARAYAPENSHHAFDQKTQTLEKTIIDRLAGSEETKTTRVLCLMMQNTNYATYRNIPSPKSESCEVNYVTNKQSIISLLFSRALAFSFKRERSQLVKRFPQLQQWLGEP